MIVYGTRSKEIAKEPLTDKCANCGASNCLDLYIFQKYAHVFWIPFFPIGKTGISQCDHCKKIWKQKEMPPNLSAHYDSIKKSAKTPLWMFSGLALVAFLLVLAIITEKKKDEKIAKLILTPAQGDVYEIRTKDNQFTLFRIEKVWGDSVYVVTSNYQTNKRTGLSELKNKAFSDEWIGIAKTELKQMLEKSDIIDIDRN